MNQLGLARGAVRTRLRALTTYTNRLFNYGPVRFSSQARPQRFSLDQEFNASDFSTTFVRTSTRARDVEPEVEQTEAQFYMDDPMDHKQQQPLDLNHLNGSGNLPVRAPTEKTVYTPRDRMLSAWEEYTEMTPEQVELYKLQAKLEMGAIDDAVARYRKALDGITNANQGGTLGPSRRIMDQWYGPFHQEIKKAIDSMPSKGASHAVISNLTALSLDKLPIIALHQAMGMLLSHPEGVPFMQVAFTVGRAVQAEIGFERMKAEDKQAFRAMLRQKCGITVTLVNMKAKYALKRNDWDTKTVVQLGAFLLKQLLASAKIDDDTDIATSDPKNNASTIDTKKSRMVNAFQHIFKFYKQSGVTRRQGILRVHENVFKLIDEGHNIREIVEPRLLPMVVPPVPWVTPKIGGYLYIPSLLMRAHDYPAQAASLWQADLSTVFASLNILSACPWRINNRVHKVVLDLWESGGGLAALPSRKLIPYPEPPADLETNVEAARAWRKTEKKIKQLNQDLHSLRSDCVLKLQVAQEMVGHRFYVPHNIDFRGRAYPLPPHLNHLGSDMARGLLLFDEARPLGPRGLWWLKIHLANLYGVDKVPHADRITFIEKNMDNIRDSAQKPTNGLMWWLKADQPFQCLAVCWELCDAIDSGDPEKWMSRTPVHQDGSCNGLQHYAALGGDELGGKKVNLVPSDAPQDVYSGVASLVAKRVSDDAAAGHDIGKVLDGKVDRKVVKQTVMTSVYGVTYIGARAQIFNALKDKDIPWKDEEQLYNGSAYLTNHTFESLNHMFLGARSIMKWLSDCAKIVAKQKEAVAWVTPLGLPVVQPYVKTATYSVKTVVQSVLLAELDRELPVNVMKQRSAFPPNYIHSLDSCHMMLTSIECNKRGMTFTSVHDSYWTHPCDVDEMNTILREQFIELHSQPLLQRLREWFIKRYGKDGVEFPPLPERGPLDLKQVLHSKYFFH